MLKNPPRHSEWLSWLWIALWSGLIFASVPTARRLQALVSERWGRESFAIFTLTVLGLVAAALLVYLARSLRRLPWHQAAWLIAVTAAFFAIAGRLESPEETLHFIEYGVLGVLCFRALSHRVRDGSIYVQATLICTLVGTFDEILQWITPQRYWEFRDVWLNAGSATLAQIAIWRSLVPSYIARRWRADGVRRACRLAIAAIALLTLCALNTPARVAWYAERIPALSFLDGNPSMMAEYGFRHEDAEIGVFFSRLSRDDLAREDQERSEAVAALIDAYAGEASYQRFQTDYPSSRDPFVHELRVHLFRRDRYLYRARAEGSNDRLESGAATVAWKENRILEKYFPHTLSASSYPLPQRRRAAMERDAVREEHYVSAVSRHLTTRIREPGLLMVSLLAIALLAVLSRVAPRLTA